jgi:hypothetical protein
MLNLFKLSFKSPSGHQDWKEKLQKNEQLQIYLQIKL